MWREKMLIRSRNIDIWILYTPVCETPICKQNKGFNIVLKSTKLLFVFFYTKHISILTNKLIISYKKICIFFLNKRVVLQIYWWFYVVFCKGNVFDKKKPETYLS